MTHQHATAAEKTEVPVVVLIEEPAVVNSGKEGVNPQEASARQSPAETDAAGALNPVRRGAASVTVVEVDPSADQHHAPVDAKKRKRRRPPRIVSVDENTLGCPILRLPPNQYETTLTRRAVRKGEGEINRRDSSESKKTFAPVVQPKQKQGHETTVNGDYEQYDEECGDISLGMKLNIIGGRVIVQSMNALADGRASPAQLTGLIQRGDVLLSVDHVSLVNLPIDQLVEALKPLSSPQNGDSYKRSLHLRFAMGEGLDALQKNEVQAQKQNSAKTDPEMDAATDIFSLSQYFPRDFPLVDQLSGMPLFEDTNLSFPSTPPVLARPVATEIRSSDELLLRASNSPMNVDQIISAGIAELQDLDRQKYLSEFFAWNEKYSGLLRTSLIAPDGEIDAEKVQLTLTQMIENGQQAILGAKAMFYNMEDIDKGKDVRSFKKWNSAISLRSRASTRRRYVLEASSGVGSVVEEDEKSDAASLGSSVSGALDEAAGDELLLKLAAHDEIWRQQVLETLANAAEEIQEDSQHPQTENALQGLPPAPDFQSIELDSFFLGETVSNLLATQKKSYSLPPEEVTSVLCDLVTSLSITPDEIGMKSNSQAQVGLVPFHKSRHLALDDDSLLASRFVFDEVFPAWLKSFRPLPWEQRRVLWDTTSTTSGVSYGGGSHTQQDDGLTLDSGSTGQPSGNRNRQPKDLRAQIEDMELDVETRADTCSLLTFYFTREILPNINDREPESAVEEADAVDFVARYGAYLKLPVCLAHAAVVKAEDVISELLNLAKHDPRHNEAMHELSKSNTLVLYETTMLSAVVTMLYGIQKEKVRDRRRDVISMCVSAYPDLHPWQVKNACTFRPDPSRPPKHDWTQSDDQFRDLYYTYLCLLLHPSEGLDSARRDRDLVKQWCELSIQTNPVSANTMNRELQAQWQARKDNFFTVASVASSEHRLYFRDLPFMMKLSTGAKERDLALNLIDELLDQAVYTRDKDVLTDVLAILRGMSREALYLKTPSHPHTLDVNVLKRVFKLWDKMGTNKSLVCRQSVVVANEVYDLLDACYDGDVVVPSNKELALVCLISNEATPSDALQALGLWTPRYRSSQGMLPALHTLLQRGAQNGIINELSGSLLRVRHLRLNGNGSGLVKNRICLEEDLVADSKIWVRMFDGTATIEK